MVILRALALIVVLLVWLVIGPFLWIPLLIRSFAFVTFNLMAAVITGSSMAQAQVSLDAALGLYGRGFRAAFAVLDDNPDTHPPALMHAPGYARLIGELVYVGLFWVATLGLVLVIMRISPSTLLGRFTNNSSTTSINDSVSAPGNVSPLSSPIKKPIYTATNGNFLIKLYGCEFSDNDTVRCDMSVENGEETARYFAFTVGGSKSSDVTKTVGATLADNRGNWYVSERGELGRSKLSSCARDTGCKLGTVALPGVVIPMQLEFDDLDGSASVAKLLRIKFSTSDKEWESPVTFKDAGLTKEVKGRLTSR